jgi:hypothetical protein
MLPRTEEINLEAPDKLGTATIKAAIETHRVSAALGTPLHENANCSAIVVTMRCHVKFVYIWSGVLPSEPIGTGRPVSAVPSSPKQAPVATVNLLLVVSFHFVHLSVFRLSSLF